RLAVLAAVLGDDAMRYITDAVGWNLRVIAARQGGHHLDRLIAEQEGLLHHGAMNRAIGDALQRGRVFVEADDLDFAFLALVLDGAENSGRIVRPQTDHANRLV